MKNIDNLILSDTGESIDSEPIPATKAEVEASEIVCPAFSVDQLINTTLFGIDLSDAQGNPFPNSLIASYLNSAIGYAESLFDICLTKKEIVGERHDYEREDYTNWGYIMTWKKPIVKVKSLKLMYGTRPSMEIPQEWLQIDKMAGKIQMFPCSGSVTTMIIGSSGAIYGLHNNVSYAPAMWMIDYEAGIEPDEIEQAMKEFIYKKATIGILQVWGDLVLGAGIANQSVSIDGLSQSIGTTQSAIEFYNVA